VPPLSRVKIDRIPIEKVNTQFSPYAYSVWTFAEIARCTTLGPMPSVRPIFRMPIPSAFKLAYALFH
jgi:hypothetical protein